MSTRHRGKAGLPTEDELEGFTDETMICWGCDKEFNVMQLRVEFALCYSCHYILIKDDK
jgi:hypothetical protein